MVEEETNGKPAATEDRPARAVLFELENVAVAGRRIAYEALAKLFKEKKAKLTPALFSRFCLDTAPSQFIPKLLEALDKSKSSPEKLLSSFTEQHRKALESTRTQANPVLKKLLKELAAHGALLGALTEVAGGDAGKRLEKMGLSGTGVTVLPLSTDEKLAPTADAWLKLAKTLSASSSACIAIVTSAASARAAMSAGMRCAAITDEFTAFQDFGGADYVAEALDADTVAGVLELLESTV
ncbi:HAD hydrolase-like protein [Verrucomicrobiota bacterium]